MSTSPDQPSPDIDREVTVASHVEGLYSSHVGLVRLVCRSVLRDRVEAEDAVQQTFLSAHRALLNGSSPRDAAAWLAAIARNESLARVRARMREPLTVEIEEHGAAPDVHASALHRQSAGELREALSQLPIRQRKAILLREVRGFSMQEVAADLSVSVAAADSLLLRARRSLQMRLREALAGLSPGPFIQPLRELAARGASGGLAAPAVAKVAVVGAGTVLAASGALVGPSVLGVGHTPRPVRAAVPVKSPTALAHPHPLQKVATVHSQPVEPRAGSDSLPRESSAGPSSSRSSLTDDTATTAAMPAGDNDSGSQSAQRTGGNSNDQQGTSGATDGSQNGTTGGDSTSSSPDSPPNDSNQGD